MTRVLQVGDTAIPYRVRFSDRASRKRIVVTPDAIVVVAPTGASLDGKNGVIAFVEKKRRWLFDAQREIAARHQEQLRQRYASGAKVQYRGRWLMLDVRTGDVPNVEISFRNKFHVVVPSLLEGIDGIEAIRAAFEAWLRERALDEAERIGRRHETSIGKRAAGYRLSEARGRWGSCGRDGVVRINWRLVEAPSAAFEYVVAHEVAHLVHRNHSPAFWKTLTRTLPDWADRKMMLERWELDHRAV